MHTPPVDALSSEGRTAPQRGSLMVYLALALVVFGVLAFAGATRFGSSIMSVFSPNCSTSARLMAESGVRYAMARLRACASQSDLTSALTAMNGTTYQVNSAKGMNFTLTLTYNSSTTTAGITAVGVGCGGSTPVSVTQSASANLPIIASLDPGVSFQKNIADFVTLGSYDGSSTVTKNTTSKTVSMGFVAATGSIGALWYGGSNTLCTNGNCSIGLGLCATWAVQIDSGSKGDGFTWTIMSGDTNTLTSIGGDSHNIIQGEYLGYAGPGYTTYGIRAPKLGMEFDTYYNPCAAKLCASSSRCDAADYDHVAFVFWGNSTSAACTTDNNYTCTTNTYDDNRHKAGDGSASAPYNSFSFDGNSDGWDGYFIYSGSGASSTWLENNATYYVRYELDRPSAANADTNYVYTERAWIKKSTDTYAAGMTNCSVVDTDSPSLVRTFALSSSLHSQLTKGIFGFTQATGGAVQQILLSNFYLLFKTAAPTYNAPTVTSGYVAGYTFYEAQGTTAHDTSGNANHLTLSNSGNTIGVLWGPDVRAMDSASLFVSGAGRASAADANSLDLTNQGTIAAWIKIRKYVTYAGIVHKGDNFDSKEAYSLQLTDTGRVGLFISNSSGSNCYTDSYSATNCYQSIQTPTNAVAADGNWYHVAASWTSSTLKIYVNGVLKTTQSAVNPKSARNVTGGLLIGAQTTSNGNGFDGYIDDVYIYNTALTDAQIANLAKR